MAIAKGCGSAAWAVARGGERPPPRGGRCNRCASWCKRPTPLPASAPMFPDYRKRQRFANVFSSQEGGGTPAGGRFGRFGQPRRSGRPCAIGPPVLNDEARSAVSRQTLPANRVRCPQGFSRVEPPPAFRSNPVLHVLSGADERRAQRNAEHPLVRRLG